MGTSPSWVGGPDAQSQQWVQHTSTVPAEQKEAPQAQYRGSLRESRAQKSEELAEGLWFEHPARSTKANQPKPSHWMCMGKSG